MLILTTSFIFIVSINYCVYDVFLCTVLLQSVDSADIVLTNIPICVIVVRCNCYCFKVALIVCKI